MADPPSLLVVSAEKWSKGKFSDVGMDNDEYTHIYIYIILHYIILYYIVLYILYKYQMFVYIKVTPATLPLV